jgi:hypothetical protein
MQVLEWTKSGFDCVGNRPLTAADRWDVADLRRDVWSGQVEIESCGHDRRPY